MCGRYSTMPRGIFVTFEGIEGSGKSTQVRLLARELEKMGRETLLVREPGGTEIGDRIRAILLDKSLEGMAPLTELFLFSANRAQLTGQVIIPSMERGVIVLSDRYHDSSVAYQGGGRGVPLDLIEGVNRIATLSITPDLTFLLDVRPETGVRRISRRVKGDPESGLDRFEVELIEFHRRIREAYLDLARRDRGRVVVLDGERDVRDVFREVREVMEGLLGKKG